MSVTFSLARVGDDGTIHISCPDADAHNVCSGGCECPEDFEHYGICDCVIAAQDECSYCSAGVNVSNTNAAQILDRLGIEFDYCGVIDPADLFGRAAVANIGRDDSGVDATEISGDGHATMIDCGMRNGYFADRLGSLERLASLAMDRGLLIAWG